MAARRSFVPRMRPGLSPVLTAFASVLLACSASSGAVVTLHDIDSGSSTPTGNYRWLNIGDQAYGTTFRTTYNYTKATVQVNYNDTGNVLSGTLSATNLKPNFAYQVKLSGTQDDTASNENIGLAGRWWQETWDCATLQWGNGLNLNNKGTTGTSPNPNDLVYLARRDIACPSSPTGKLYRYSGYLVFDYFLTDDSGGATVPFQATSSYHVLWKTSQAAPSVNDGPTKSQTFDPSLLNPAYDTDWSSATVGVYGEWERLPVGGVLLQPGDYSGQMMLTEESFHGSGGTYAGEWAAAMGGDVSFFITIPEPSTILLMGTAALGAAGYLRRRRLH